MKLNNAGDNVLPCLTPLPARNGRQSYSSVAYHSKQFRVPITHRPNINDWNRNTLIHKSGLQYDYLFVPTLYIHLYSPRAVTISNYEKKKQCKHIDIQYTVYLTNKTIATIASMYQNYRYKPLCKPLSLNFCSKLTVRLANVTLGRSKPR